MVAVCGGGGVCACVGGCGGCIEQYIIMLVQGFAK